MTVPAETNLLADCSMAATSRGALDSLYMMATSAEVSMTMTR